VHRSSNAFRSLCHRCRPDRCLHTSGLFSVRNAAPCEGRHSHGPDPRHQRLRNGPARTRWCRTDESPQWHGSLGAPAPGSRHMTAVPDRQTPNHCKDGGPCRCTSIRYRGAKRPISRSHTCWRDGPNARTPSKVVVHHVRHEKEPTGGHDARFIEFGQLWVDILRTLGVEAQLGAVPGEYCPGAHSVNRMSASTPKAPWHDS